MQLSLESLTRRIESLEFAAKYFAASSIWTLLDALEKSAEWQVIVELYSDTSSASAFLKRGLALASHEPRVPSDALSDADIAVTLYLRLLARLAPRSAHVLARAAIRVTTFYNAKRYALLMERVVGSLAPAAPIADSTVNTRMVYSGVQAAFMRGFIGEYANVEASDEIHDVFFARYADDVFRSDIDAQPSSELASYLAMAQAA